MPKARSLLHVSEIELPFIRSAHNYNRDEASDEAGLLCPECTLTQQQFKEEADINTIIERFGINGEMPTDIRMPTFEDFTNIHDFQGAMNAIALARESFDTLPANVRARFNNEPSEFVAFCDDPNNRAEAEKIGLVRPKPAAPIPEPPKEPIAVPESLKKPDPPIG